MERTLKIIVVALLTSGAAVACAWGEEGRPEHPAPQPAHPPDGPRPYLQWSHATGDWGGMRATLEQKGIRPEASLIADWSRNLRGGVNTEGEAFRHLFNFNLTLLSEPLGAWKGGTFFLNFQTQNGASASDDVGDIQGVGNLDADGRTQLSELWYEQNFLEEEELRVKIGKIDATTEFALPAHGVNFLNASFEVSPTILSMPTYPDPSFGVVGAVAQDPFFDFRLGLFDGALQESVPTGSRGPRTLAGSPSDLFLIAELGLRSNIPTRWAVGVWHHTGTFDRFDGGRDSGVTGIYIVGDYTLWQEDEQNVDEQGIGLFYQYGYVDGDVSAIEHHIGGGVVWTGALPRRDDDVIGLGASYVEFSEESGLDDDDGELAVEMFYKAQLTPFFSLTGDLQYIADPAGAEGARDALVVTVRAVIDL